MRSRFALALVLVVLALASCDDATMIVASNGYSAADGAIVYQVWWAPTFVPDPIAPQAESPAYRSVPSTGYAYALLARGWDPAAAPDKPPASLVVVRTRDPLTAARGETLRVVLAPETVVGDCATGETLSQAEANLVTQSIFPGPFVGAVYDATTCKTARPPTP